MGHVGSKERRLFVDILKTMLRARGVKVSGAQITKFMCFVQDCCPWFPEEGTVNLETWQKVGKALKNYYTVHGPEKDPAETFSFWSLIRDALDPTHEIQKFENESPTEKTPLLSSSTSNFEVLNRPDSDDEGSDKENDNGNDPDILSPQDEETLEEEAARYHGDDWAYPALLSEKLKKRLQVSEGEYSPIKSTEEIQKQSVHKGQRKGRKMMPPIPPIKPVEKNEGPRVGVRAAFEEAQEHE